MMEKKVKNLPPGFRFHPTDEELVVQYLLRKVLSFSLPALPASSSIIPSLLHVCHYDPSHLPGDGGQERYFFTIREAKYPNGNKSNRATACGYWKATGIDKQIVASKSNQIVGMKKTLIYYRGKAPHGARTGWVMHEYRLICNGTNSKEDNWVLCRIFLKKRMTSNNEAGETCINKPPVLYDFMRKNKVTTDLNLLPTTSSTSDSSGITDDDDDVSSQSNTSWLQQQP